MIDLEELQLVRLQDSSGCFPSTVEQSGRVSIDHNGFTTAMVVRDLRAVSRNTVVDVVKSRALDFIERCRANEIPLAFAFWPADRRPNWANRVPADVDDTAIMATELLRAGRLSRRDALSTVCHVFLPHRVGNDGVEERPAWIEPGAFLTWIGKRGKPNVVDCCVNVNALALMAWVEAHHLPGYQEAVTTVLRGLDWAGDNPARLRSLTPFYPSVSNLRDAVEHAVESGVTDLRTAIDPLHRVTGDGDALEDRGCCSSAYGAAVWRCPAIEVARALRRGATSTTHHVWQHDPIPAPLGQSA